MLSTAGLLAAYTSLLLVSDASHFSLLSSLAGCSFLCYCIYLESLIFVELGVYIGRFSFMHKGWLKDLCCLEDLSNQFGPLRG